MRRRDVIAGLSVSASAAFFAPAVIGQTRPRVVIIGAGAGGASAARLLGTMAGDALDITLIEAAPAYTSPFFSNHVLGGLRTIDSITHDWKRLGALDGVRIINDRVEAIDRDRQLIQLASGQKLGWDRLIASPGVTFRGDLLPGFDDEKTPHGWGGHRSLSLLDAQIANMPDDGVFGIVTPPYPHRCSVAAYERASLVAARLTREKPDGSVLIIDHNPRFAMQSQFEEAWADYYDGLIERIGPDLHGGISGVDPDAITINTDFEDFEVSVINVIPHQTASRLLLDAELGGSRNYCDVDAATMKSRQDARVHILGDSANAGKMTRSASSAVAQAGLVVSSVLADLTDMSGPQVSLDAVCWSLVAENDAIALSESYKVDSQTIDLAERAVSSGDETADDRKKAAIRAEAWYKDMIAGMFG